jgi:polysaccharide transporter, PST family
MSLVKTTVLNGVAVGVRMITGLIVNKILAIFVGPAGYAIVGQFQNFVQIISTAGTGAIQTGVTKYTAEYGSSPERLRKLWQTSGGLIALLSTVAAIGIVLASVNLAEGLLRDRSFYDVFLWLAGGLVFFGFNTMLIAILNGKKDLRRYVASNLAGSGIILVGVGTLTWLYGLRGTLIALAIQQALTLIVTVYVCRNADWFRPSSLVGRIDSGDARRLLSFALMAGASVAANAGGQMLVRNHIAEVLDWTSAGHWDAMVRLSALNWILINSSMALYFLPRIAETDDWAVIRQEMLNGARLILPFFLVCCTGVYLLREQIVLLLFSSQFLPMEALFGWQLAGDFLRVASWFFAYIMLSKGMVSHYIASEFITNALFVAITFQITERFGTQGAVIAHFITYLIMLPVLYAFMLAGRRRLQSAVDVAIGDSSQPIV